MYVEQEMWEVWLNLRLREQHNRLEQFEQEDQEARKPNRTDGTLILQSEQWKDPDTGDRIVHLVLSRASYKDVTATREGAAEPA